MNKRIFHVTQQIEANLDRNWTVEMMAADAGLSVSHLHHAFRELIGMTPIAYVRERRLMTAFVLIVDQDCLDSIKEIAARCGCFDASDFTRDFKTKYGMTPTECKKQAEDDHQRNFPTE
ncbi:MAG: helix-turn-helix transcriptional regulator [Pyrinomonadaceae bacterium]